jgi:hypothetical protein
MPVFVELVTDSFAQSFAGQAASSGGMTGRAGAPNVRRPMRGVEIKDDTYAILKVVRSDGTPVKLIDSSAPGAENDEEAARAYQGYSNFILQSVQESRMEKHRVIETFGDSYVMFFGENPRFLDCSAVLVNSQDFNWEAEWWENYDRYLRGTKCVEQGARCYLFYDDNIVEGYILMAQAAKSADQPRTVQLQFKFFITAYKNISIVEDPTDFPIRSSVWLPDDVQLTSGDAAAKLTSKYQGDAYEGAAGRTLDNSWGIGAIGPSPAGGYKKISDAYRAAARSYAFSPDMYRALAQVPESFKRDIERLVSRTGLPLRSAISNNVDEYTGRVSSYPAGSDSLPEALTQAIRRDFEAQDLFREAIKILGCFGADINNPTSMASLGLSASFVASAGASATFGPTGANAQARASAGVQVGFDSLQQFTRDPLGNVYGQPFADGRAKDPRYTQGAGDPAYGYPSDFAQGPGFGQAGFGDFGGLGFGSGLGAQGDPGFKDPSKFTFAGVSSNQGAWDRFVTPVVDPTSFGGQAGAYAGASASAGAGARASAGAYAGAQAGGSASAYAGASAAGTFGANAVNQVGGRSSAFAFVAVEGSLNAAGTARTDPRAASELQQQQKFGFSTDNPFGVSCPNTSGGEVVGKSWSKTWSL